jgi:hypothetical protein
METPRFPIATAEVQQALALLLEVAQTARAAEEYHLQNAMLQHAEDVLAWMRAQALTPPRYVQDALLAFEGLRRDLDALYALRHQEDEP